MDSSCYLTIMQRIHVMVVDHHPQTLVNIAKMLEMCRYKVTVVELASAALTMLTSQSPKFDFVLADINSPDLHGFKLIQQATNLHIPIIVMSDADNAFIAARAVENGAYLCIKKPVTMEMATCVWQCVLKEKMRVMVGGAESERVARTEKGKCIGESTDENSSSGEGGGYEMMKNGGKGKKKMKGRKGSRKNEEAESGLEMNNNNKRRAFTEWTQELHQQFMAAVQQLGEGRCFPKEILDLMNVSGLTRMQVASHLQKCRNNNWRTSEERKSSGNFEPISSPDVASGRSQIRARKFGTMPILRKPTPSYPAQIQQTAEGGGGGHSSATLPGNDFGRIDNINASLEHIVNLITYHPNFDLNPNPSHVSGGGRVAGSSSSSNPHGIINQSSEDQYLCFQDMDCLIQDIPGILPGQASAAGMMGGGSDPCASTADYHFDPQLHHDQNAIASMAGMDGRVY